MTAYVTAARIAAVVALFALPPMLVPDDAAAADRRYGTRQSTQSPRRAPQPVYVPPPPPRPNTKEFVRNVCRSYKAMGRPLEYKECMDSQR